ncbi:MAG TPA: glycosyltransferase family 4 protein [Ktedonobacteraceae bacterium]|nr:glycosyltransferase family 4 protein [Ktedonobacteraceae bacterium]
MAHVLFISPYYPPEKGAASVCVSENAKRLVQRGHHVTVLTTVPNYPTGIVPPRYRGKLLQREVIDGVDVVRAWSYASPNKGFLRRILAQLSFGCLAPWLGKKAVGQPDIIIVQSPPLFDAIAARALARIKRCPFIFMVSDLWPESAVQLGALHHPLLIRLSEWLEWSTYRRAALVWVVTEGIRAHLLRRGLADECIMLLTNGVDTERFTPMPIAQARARLGWDKRFTVLYAGTHGLSHGLTTILDAAERLREREDIHIVLAGDGAEKAALVEQARQRSLTNVTFYEPFSHDLIPTVIGAADVCLVHVRKNIPVFDGMLPIKMIEAMACGRPILLGIGGEARRVADHEARAAFSFEQENAESLANGILYLSEHREYTNILGRNGRTFAEAIFSYDHLVDALDERIRELLGETSVATHSLSGGEVIIAPADDVPMVETIIYGNKRAR